MKVESKSDKIMELIEATNESYLLQGASRWNG